MSRRILVIGSWTNGKPAMLVSDAELVVRGFFFPTPLLVLWAAICGPWKSDRSAVCRN